MSCRSVLTFTPPYLGFIDGLSAFLSFHFLSRGSFFMVLPRFFTFFSPGADRPVRSCFLSIEAGFQRPHSSLYFLLCVSRDRIGLSLLFFRFPVPFGRACRRFFSFSLLGNNKIGFSSPRLDLCKAGNDFCFFVWFDASRQTPPTPFHFSLATFFLAISYCVLFISSGNVSFSQPPAIDPSITKMFSVFSLGGPSHTFSPFHRRVILGHRPPQRAAPSFNDSPTLPATL